MASTPKSPIGKVFVDSTVFMAAAISAHGSARDLLLLCIRGDIELVISPLVLEETERNVRSKAPASLADFLTFRDTLPAELITPTLDQVTQATAVVHP